MSNRNPRPDNESWAKIQKAVANMDFATTLETVPWEFFVTPTFAGSMPRPAICYAQAFKLLRKIAEVHVRPYNQLLIALRGEFGEQNGRFHFHILVGGVTSRNNISTCHIIQNLWKVDNRGARIDVRLYDSRLGAAAYIGKGLGWSNINRAKNAYELAKTSAADTIILSDSVYRYVACRDYRSSRGL
jgi:hypothetical protein